MGTKYDCVVISLPPSLPLSLSLSPLSFSLPHLLFFSQSKDVEIKKLGGSATYGFVLFYDLLHAIQAKKYMDGESLGGNKIRVRERERERERGLSHIHCIICTHVPIKVGFGKGTPSRLLWVDGVDPMLSETQLEKHFSQFGKVLRLGVDRSSYTAMVQYDTVDDAKEAMEAVKGGYIGNSRSKIMVCTVHVPLIY